MKHTYRSKLSIGIFIFMLLLPFVGSAYRPARLQAVHMEGSASISTCPMFPADNFWNVPIENLPVDSYSTAWVNSIGANTAFHMDFGSGTWDGGSIGIPYNIVSNATSTPFIFDFYYPDESDTGPYPLPANPKIEWGSDHHILTVNTSDCKLYEIYDAWHDGAGWHGGSGAIWDLNSNALRTDTWTSADAAGLPILPGLARYDEVAAGVINHALRFTADCTANYYIWPARHVARSGSCATPVPFGARFRLKAGFDISGYSPQAQVLLQAFKTYGIVLADNGSNWYVSGTPNEGWNNDFLHELDSLRGSDFEAVDTSGLMVDPNSGATSAFSKTFPLDLAVKVSLTPALSWALAPGATKYEYCLDQTFSLCNSNWVDNGPATSVSITTPLLKGMPYVWQVRATTPDGIKYANLGYWSFTTGDQPGAFDKTQPFDNAVNQPLDLTVRWASSSDVDHYEYCFALTNSCTDWINANLVRSVILRRLQPSTTYYWQVRAVNDFGYAEANDGAWYSFTTTSLHNSAFISDPAKDGWMLEASEFSSVANRKSNTGNLLVGDDRFNHQYRSLLYFDTASLPDNVIITKATLLLCKIGVTGDISALGDLVADIKKGFFGLAPLELGDFSAVAAPIRSIGRFTTFADPEYRLLLSPSSSQYINRTGVTQFRLRFPKDDNNNKIADFISFYSGDAASADQPQLIIEYYVP